MRSALYSWALDGDASTVVKYFGHLTDAQVSCPVSFSSRVYIFSLIVMREKEHPSPAGKAPFPVSSKDPFSTHEV